MSHMQAQRQGELKYPTSTLLKSSNNLGWSTLFAELRSHNGDASGRHAPLCAVRRCTSKRALWRISAERMKN